MNREIGALTGLRGIAALWVFAYHAAYWADGLGQPARLTLKVLSSGGYLGVDVFFVLSGFVLALNYGSARVHASWSTYAKFLWKRIARIWPVHVVALAFMVCVLGAMASLQLRPALSIDVTAAALLQSVALVQAWTIPIERIWNSPAWSLSAEWAAYLAFPFIAALTARILSAIRVIGCILGLYAILYLVADSTGLWSLGLGMPRIAVGFTAGVLLFRLHSMLGHQAIGRYGLPVTVGYILLANVLDTVTGRETSMLMLPWVACLVVYTVANTRGPAWLSSPASIYLGRLSFAFYMVHWIVLQVPRSYLQSAELADSIAAVATAIVLSLAVCWLLAHVLYRYVEVPARSAMLKVLEGKRVYTGSSEPTV